MPLRSSATAQARIDRLASRFKREHAGTRDRVIVHDVDANMRAGDERDRRSSARAAPNARN